MRVMNGTWQKILANGFASSSELLAFLGLPVSLASEDAEKVFATRVPRGFAARMRPNDPNDPLLRQVLAVSLENEDIAFVKDPLEERAANPLPGLIHKYHGRVLLTPSGSCAVNCRYCFRRHFPYAENNPGRAGWQAVLEYVAAHPEVYEVILSGGDPLLVSNASLARLIEGLSAIAHVRILRFHTRFPVVLPERIDDEFLHLLAGTRLDKVMVLHANHAQELDEQVRGMCAALRGSSVHLLNQAVLLAGVNDDVKTLASLSRRLFECGVLPYYLHLLDHVQGAAHFDLPHARALALYRALQEQLPGYLVPRLAREEPGKKHKTLFV